MSIFKRTGLKIISSNMTVPMKSVVDKQFKINDVIQHLLDNESDIVNTDPLNMDLLDVCLDALEVCREDTILFDNSCIVRGSNLRPRTFFHPTCRIIRIDLTESHKTPYNSTKAIPKSLIETGYEMVPRPWAHSVVIIKIERMTDSSCFASWTLVN